MRESDFKILVVDDDFDYAETCARVIAGRGYHVKALGSADEALETISSNNNINLVVTDLKMPGKDGTQLLQEVKAINPAIEVIIMTGYGSIESAVKAIKDNATDYITKPFNKSELLNSIQQVYKIWKLQNEVQQLKKIVTHDLHLDGYVFSNALMMNVYDRITSAARCDCSVFISGESGTGKELFATAIHKNSRRTSGPFVAINCSALSRELIESELFGYRKGAFTGASQDHEGLMMSANGGTLFLDELVEMQPGTQAKLLRSIQERTIRPVGSVEELKIDVRFIAATNTDLQNALSRKLLREDLYHRLNVIPINVPPLRKTSDEIAGLLQYFVDKGNQTHDFKIKAFDDNAVNLLTRYRWPGNIRELENLVERLFAERAAEIITSKDLPANITSARDHDRQKATSVPSFSEAEKDLIIKALKESNGNKSKAAEILGISRPRLYKKIDQYNIKNL